MPRTAKVFTTKRSQAVEQRLTADSAPTGAAREETRPFTAKQGQ
jgi:hypothetical protein